MFVLWWWTERTIVKFDIKEVFGDFIFEIEPKGVIFIELYFILRFLGFGFIDAFADGGDEMLSFARLVWELR